MADSTRCAPTPVSALSIAGVEREIGIAKDRLRVWERRYGFPAPLRDASGDRLYPAEQVAKLKLVKRLLDAGHAPRNLLSLETSELSDLLAPQRGAWHADVEIHKGIGMLRDGELKTFESWLRGTLVREGLERFVLGTGRTIIDAIGDAWEAGEITVWHEHFFTAAYVAMLGSALANVTAGDGPHVVLATPTGERHGLGLLMARALFTVRGAACLTLGEDIPNSEIVACAERTDADVVALSLSVGYGAPRATSLLSELRDGLPARTELWVGGAAVSGLKRSRTLRDNIRLFPSLDEGVAALGAMMPPTS
ncbi:MAG TPA: MerR family transcriptional regulator [Alphaproteobacteria bacterium]|jgi:methanogenic corrinoid protein MtbC1|nr:MerR family transcriptional regulator [Alphaproteobacteria bacterium]